MILDAAYYPATDTWVAAIHSSAEDLEPLGTGVVIDERRILTCAHVIIQDGNPREPLWVAFPKADESTDERRRVVGVRLPDKDVYDVAVLTLAEAVPAGVTPATLRCPRPTDLVNRRWWAFGFGNGDPFGNAADGAIGAALGYGRVRLDADSRYHVALGFSGGGLWSPDYEAVVGVVGAANERGDGQAITLYQAQLCLPGEKLRALTEWSADAAGSEALAAWGWTLETDPEAGRHWQPRARGVTVETERGYRFRGRTAALGSLVEWLERPEPDHRALVVTGSPGVGKSAVLGRIVTTADPAVRAALPSSDSTVRARVGSVACAVHAKGKTALEVAIEIARSASAALPERADDLARVLRDALTERDRGRFNVIIDALDEATDPKQTRTIITKIVLPLVETCADIGTQVVVGSRLRDDAGDLLKVFGDALSLINLDDDQFFSLDDLQAYAFATLQLFGQERANNPYNDALVAQPIAAKIAQLSNRNFLIAGLVAKSHGLYDTAAIDISQLAFTANVDNVLHEYLQRLEPISGVSAGDMLTALAFAEAPGFSIDLWSAAIEAITGDTITIHRLARFARSSAANFLVEFIGDGPSRVFRLFHQALNDALLRARSQAVPTVEDERSLTLTFLSHARQGNWSLAPRYLLRSLPAHAERAGMIDALLADDEYFLYADLARVIPVADRSTSVNGRRRARLLRLTPRLTPTNSKVRTALFSITEALENLGNAYRRTDRPAPYWARWASAAPHTERLMLEGHVGEIRGICAFTLEGRTLLASAGNDGTVRVWAPDTGTEEHVLRSNAGAVYGVCAFTLEGRTLLASAMSDGTVRVWDIESGERDNLLTGHAGAVYGVCAFTLDDRTLLAGVGYDGTVRIWDPSDGEQEMVFSGHIGRVGEAFGICAFQVGNRVLLASAGDDATVRIWDPVMKRQRYALKGHLGWVLGVCAFELGRRVLLASVGDDTTVRIWDADDGTEVEVFRGHGSWANSICAFNQAGKTLLASAGSDGTVRIWEAETGLEERAANDQTEEVHGLSTFTQGEKTMLATAGNDATVRIWDLDSGDQLRVLQTSSGLQGVTAVLGFIQRGKAMLAVGGSDGAVRIWDAEIATPAQVMRDPNWDEPVASVCAFVLGGHAVLASAIGASVVIWDLDSGRVNNVIHDPFRDTIAHLCTFELQGRTLLAAAFGNSVLCCDPGNRDDKEVLIGHTEEVHSVCTLKLNDRMLLASASADRSVRIWDLASMHEENVLEGHTEEVYGVCAFNLEGRMLLASASADRTVRIWDPIAANCLQVIPVHHKAFIVGYTDGVLIIGLSAGLIVIELNPGSLAPHGG